jgi:hypothetical protein
MRGILYQYEINPTTWVYLSSLMMIGIYFKFGRFWSVRNLDLLGLIALAPGLLVVARGGEVEPLGYLWLFAAGGFFLVRLLLDPLMVRRPLLEPNLSPGGLAFTGIALLVFLFANVVRADLSKGDLESVRQLDELLGRRDASSAEAGEYGPGYRLFLTLPRLSTETLVRRHESLSEEESWRMVAVATVQTMAILSHLAILAAMLLIGYLHFDSIRTGIAAGTLYLLLPYTAQMTSQVGHVLPAALLVWAVAAYRRPIIAGMLLGLASGLIYYPLFLVPLWCGFYWQRGLARFVFGVVSMLALVNASLIFTSVDFASYLTQTEQMFGITNPLSVETKGFWAYNVNEPAFRIPVLAAFMALCGGLAIWPAQKNLGTLLSCSAAVMLATQFWQAKNGGLYMAWYLPLLLLTIFRPNLEDRTAATALGEGWFSRRRTQPLRVEKPA